MKRLAILALIALSSCGVAAAQSASTATIVGQVLDPQGAVVPNATVTATNTATGVGRSVVTTSTGNYTIPNLPPGTYEVKVEEKGFATGVTKNVALNVGDQRDLSFKLAVGGSTESIEVTTSAPLIESTKTDVSTTVTNLDMERLPTFAGTAVIGGAVNDYAQLALTAPGVKSDTSGLTTGDLIAPGSTNNRGNLYNVDGANITDQLVSGRDSTGASVDEVQEFQVITNTYNAEYGQATGLVLNAVTKSGTNAVHGVGARALHRRPQVFGRDPRVQRGECRPVHLPSKPTVGGLEIQQEPVSERRAQARAHEPLAAGRAADRRGGRGHQDFEHARDLAAAREGARRDVEQRDGSDRRRLPSRQRERDPSAERMTDQSQRRRQAERAGRGQDVAGQQIGVGVRRERWRAAMPGEIERDDREVRVPCAQLPGESREIASTAEQTVQQHQRPGAGAGASVGEGQEARRIPERSSHSSWARSEAPRMRDMFPQ